jgi:hypothetical protein
MGNAGYIREVRTAWGAVLAGLLLAAVIWHGADMMNFVVTWVPQAIVVIVMFFIGVRPAALAGAALALAAHILSFHLWVASFTHVDGLAWLLYLTSLPGGLVGGIVAATWLRNRDEWGPLAAGLVSALLVGAGIAVIHTCWMLQ